MSHQDSNDISNVQVPDSFIQEILNETQPLKEGREEVHPKRTQTSKVQEDSVTPQGGIVELVSLLFEEFDKLNARLDTLQESLTEMTSVGSFGVGPGEQSCYPKKHSRRKRSSKKVRTESTNALAELLANRSRG